MAYNPFNIFRRNQKALFAVLTVFIMIMFTLQSGVMGGDAFEWFSRWLGGRKGDAVCKIDGSTIKDSEIARVRRNRVMANTFMSLAAAQTANEVQTYVSGQQPRLSEEGKQMAQAAGQAATFLSLTRGNPQLLDTPMFGSQTPRQMINSGQQFVDFVLTSPTAKSEDKDVARAYRALLDLTQQRNAGEGGHFFVNAPNGSTRDAIDFLLWEKKADQLGIAFTTDDVKVLLNREFYGFFKSDVDVRKTMQQQQGFNMDTMLSALAVEFKVRAAQTAVLGPAAKSRPTAGPVFGTPYEMFDYYREQCSPATYDLLAVPALAFADKVTGEPTAAELNDLYKKHANEEPNPGRESFGFMEPRKLSVSWLALTGTEPYYEKLAAEQVKVGEAMAKASGLTAVPVPGGGAGWAMAAAAPLALKEPAVDAAYTTYKNEFERKLNGERFGAYETANLLARDLLPTSVVRPATLAATLGAMVGQTAPFGGPAAAASLAMGPPIGYEIRDRIKTGLPLFLGATPGPALFQTMLGGAVGYKQSEPKPLSIEAMRPELLKKTVADRAKALAFGAQPNLINPTATVEKGDLATFIEGMEKLAEKGKPKDTAAVEKYIADFRAARGLTKQGEQFGSTTAPRDEWSIEEDPGLMPLAFAQRDALAGARGPHGGNQYIPFGRSFFWSAARDPSGGVRRTATAGVYVAKPYPPEDRGQATDDRPRYVYWVTEDSPAKKMNADTAKERVRAAWKRTKARELAKARADAIAEAIRTSSASSPDTIKQTVSDQAFKFRAQIPAANDKAFFRAKSFTLKDVCPLTPFDISSLDEEMIQRMRLQNFNPFGRLQPFQLNESENIPYPTQEMEKALLENRDKPAKTVLVLPDAPKDTYYVATLVKRDLRSPKDFKDSVYTPGAPARNVLGDYAAEAARKSRQSVVELLKKEFDYAETDEQKKRLDENAKSGSRE